MSEPTEPGPKWTAPERPEVTPDRPHEVEPQHPREVSPERHDEVSPPRREEVSPTPGADLDARRTHPQPGDLTIVRSRTAWTFLPRRVKSPWKRGCKRYCLPGHVPPGAKGQTTEFPRERARKGSGTPLAQSQPCQVDARFSRTLENAASKTHGEVTMQTSTEQSSSSGSLAMYLSEINQYPLLTVDEEQKLARRFAKGDLQAGHRLVTSNLRFVVKVSYEYRSYGIKMCRPDPGGEHRPDEGGAEVRRRQGHPPDLVRGLVDPRVHPELHPQELVAGEARHHPGAAEAVLLARPHPPRAREAEPRRHHDHQRGRDRQAAAREAPARSARWSSGWAAATSRSTRRWARTAATATSTSWSPRRPRRTTSSRTRRRRA